MDAINWQTQDKIDVDEVECIIANLMMKKYIKGYLIYLLGTSLTIKGKSYCPSPTPFLQYNPLFQPNIKIIDYLFIILIILKSLLSFQKYS